MGLTDAQLEARRQWLGGTDMSALAGMSPYARPIDVWRDKVGLPSERRTNPMMSMGSLLEPVVASLFSAATGMVLRRPAAPVRDRQRPWLGGSIDRWANPADWRWLARHDGQVPPPVRLPDLEAGIFEAKWGMRDDLWGPTHPVPDGGARVPPGYRVQVQHYCGVTGRPVAYLGVLLGYADFRWYALPADPDAIGVLRELGDRFWHDNVVPQVPPEPDGTEEYGRWLADRYRTDDGTEAVATASQQLLWQQYFEVDAHAKEAAQAVDLAKQRLQDSMGTTAKLLLPDGHILWRSHEVRTVDWKAVATDLAEDVMRHHPAKVDGTENTKADVLAGYASAHTTTATQRPFKPHHKSEET